MKIRMDGYKKEVKMPPFTRELGRVLLIAGGIIAGLGLLLYLGGRIPFLGNLPGDFSFENDRFSFYFPLGSAVLISLILSGLANLVIWLLNR